MVWTAETSNGRESAKIRFEVMRHLIGTGVDLGCGDFKVAKHVIGVDQGNDPVIDICANITKLPIFADGSFDFVFSSHALEDQEDTEATLREWWRLVKPGGKLILYLPHKDFYPNVGQPGANPNHKHDFLPSDIVEVMKRVGSWDLIVNEDRNKRDEYSFLQVYVKCLEGHEFSHAKPRPEKTACVVRLGAFGDALWCSSICSHLKEQGYHVSVMTETPGLTVLREDPNIDEFIEWGKYQMTVPEMVPYFGFMSMKFDKWVNLTQSVEVELLPTRRDWRFYLADGVRKRLMNRNYLETIHLWAELPYHLPREAGEPETDYRLRYAKWSAKTFRQRFYPSDAERERAQAERNKHPGPVAIINPSGSSMPKWYPFTQELTDLLLMRGIAVYILGDTRGKEFSVPEGMGRVIGLDWEIRDAFAFAMCSDLVVGVESSIINAVAMEQNVMKVALLSHSSAENLTKHWVNCIAIESEGRVPCYPCHRIHEDMTFCFRDAQTVDSAACQSISPDEILLAVDKYLPLICGKYKAPEGVAGQKISVKTAF